MGAADAGGETCRLRRAPLCFQRVSLTPSSRSSRATVQLHGIRQLRYLSLHGKGSSSHTFVTCVQDSPTASCTSHELQV